MDKSQSNTATAACPTEPASCDLVAVDPGEPRRRSLARQAGMTLLEILIVLAIIALVMGFLFGPRIMEMFGQAKEETAGMQVNRYANDAYAQWTMANPGKQCPDTLAELAKYTNDQKVKDPWGNELSFVCGESAPEGVPNRFGVISKGADGKLDTGDDLRSWERKKE